MAATALQFQTGDERRLRQLEAEITDLLSADRKNDYEIGIRIRESREVYQREKRRKMTSGTFEDFCFERWKLRQRYIYYLIDYVQVNHILCTAVHESQALDVPMVTGGAARPLMKIRKPDDTGPDRKRKILDPDAIRECYQEAEKQATTEGKPVTACIPTAYR